MTDVLLLVLALLLSVACGAFVAAEFSLTTVERSDLEQAAERGERGAGSALEAVHGLTFHLSGAQLGITVTNLVVGMLSEPSLGTLLAGPLGAVGVPGAAVRSTALVLGTALSTGVLMIVGELVPKNWAISRPLPVARRVATPQRVFSAAFRPFIAHLNNTANRTLRRMNLEPAEELASARGPRELTSLARHSAEAGALEEDTAELFVRTLNLGELTAQSVMTPRVRVVALDERAFAEDVANITRATGLSRFPVYRDTLDTVVGTVHIKDVLAVPADERPHHPVSGVMRAPLVVPESLPVDRLLDRMSSQRSMAVVIDEYGGTAGVVTLEDIVEEVIGDVRDEHDPLQAPQLAVAGRDARGRTLYDADGAVRVDQLRSLGLRAPDGPYETVAGLVATELGRIPTEGDTITVTGWQIEVIKASGHRAARVRLREPSSGAPDAREGRGTQDGRGGPAGAGRSDAAEARRSRRAERGERGTGWRGPGRGDTTAGRTGRTAGRGSAAGDTRNGGGAGR